jgi:hypothetical protein
MFAMFTFSIAEVQGQKPTISTTPIASEDAEVISDCDCVRMLESDVKVSKDYLPGCKPVRFQFQLCNFCDDKPVKPYKITLVLPYNFKLTNANGYVLEPQSPCTDDICSKRYAKMVQVPTTNKNDEIQCITEFVEGQITQDASADCPLDPDAKYRFIVNFEDINKNFTGCNTVDVAPKDCLIDENTFGDVLLPPLSITTVGGNAANFGSFFTSCSTAPGGAISTVFYVKDDLDFTGSSFVQPNFCLKGQDIVIAPNKKIRVKNATLDLISCRISGCDQMWHSITAEENGRITTNVEKGLGAMTIRDGQYALQAIGATSTIFVKQTNFTDNYISAQQDANQSFIIENSTFKGSGKLLPAPIPLDNIPYTGINSINDSELQVNDSKFSNMANALVGRTTNIGFGGNEINDMKKASYNTNGYGIHIANGKLRDLYASTNKFTKCESASVYTYNANSTVQNNKVSSTPIGVQILYGVTTKVTKNAFDAADFGVKIWGSKKLSLDILDNDFKNGNEKGIELWFNSYTKQGLIKGNTMVLNGDAAIESYNAGTMGKSIVIENNPTISLKGLNTINLQGAPHGVIIRRNPNIAVTSGTSGISIKGGTLNTAFCNVVNAKSSAYGVNNSISNEFTITCNTVTNNQKGFHFDGVCTSTDAFAGNSMNGGTGLSVGAAGIIGTQKYQGNLWFGSGAINENTDFPKSQFTVYTGAPITNAKQLKPNPVNPSAWFEDIATSPNEFQKICNSGTCAKTTIPPVPPTLSDGDTKILSDGSYQTPNLTPSQWMEKRALYFRLKENSSLISEGGETAQNFVNATDESALGSLYITYKKMQALFDQSDEEINANNVVNEAIEAQNTLTETINNELLVQVSQELVAKKQEINKQLHALRTQRDEQNEIWTKIVNDRITDTEISNDAIEITNILESNERTINTLYLKAIARDTPLNDDEVSTLAHIALQCPYQGGEAVYRARSLYALYDKFNDYNDDDCSKYKILTRVQANHTIDSPLYPNPAYSDLMIEMPKEYASSKIEIVFFNSFSQIVQRNTVSGIDVIDISGLMDGIYTCLIYDKKDNRLLSTQKLSIIK